MPSDAVFVQRPAVDFTTLVGVCHKALGYSPASAADASHRALSDAERFLWCLAAARDRAAPGGLTPNLLAHASFSILLMADDRDLVSVLEPASGMSFVVADAVLDGVQLAVVTGTLAEWRDAVKSGTSAAAKPPVRALYSKVFALFERAGLGALWSDCSRREASGQRGLLLLEDKRK